MHDYSNITGTRKEKSLYKNTAIQQRDSVTTCTVVGALFTGKLTRGEGIKTNKGLRAPSDVVAGLRSLPEESVEPLD